MKHKIIQGNCIDVMKTLPDNSVDAIITDPPYDLVSINKRFGKEGSTPAQFGKDGSFSRLSKGFMGKQWDGTGIAFKTETWKEALRVLKAGGYLLSFGGTRTYHRMATAIEDAGFEIRDMINWVYGSGFPKSLNIGKAVDKLQGNEREVVGYTEPFGREGRKTSHSGGFMKENMKYKNKPDKRPIYKTTNEYEGWGTALKPSHEPIVMARKPLSEKTVAKNILKWGTGGINIDECRIGTDEILSCGSIIGKGMFSRGEVNTTHIGRFPANLIHNGSEEVLKNFPDVEDDKPKDKVKHTQLNLFNDKIEKNIINSSRFFYCAKASKSERNYGCDELKAKYQDESREIGSAGGTNPRNRGAEKPIKNHHPTVKPVALMEYLIKLVTPEGGIVLEPFAGSGTTLVACVKLGYNFIGIEKEEEYIKIIQARIKPYLEQTKLKEVLE